MRSPPSLSPSPARTEYDELIEKSFVLQASATASTSSSRAHTRSGRPSSTCGRCVTLSLSPAPSPTSLSSISLTLTPSLIACSQYKKASLHDDESNWGRDGKNVFILEEVDAPAFWRDVFLETVRAADAVVPVNAAWRAKHGREDDERRRAGGRA
mgnify:CR=1 FL=1